MIRAFFIVVFLSISGGHASAQIFWEIENRFRILDGKNEQKRFEQDFERYKFCAGLPLSRPVPPQCASNSLHELSLDAYRTPYRTLWEHGEYSFPSKRIRNKERTIVVTFPGALQGERCTWLVDGKVKENLGRCRGETLEKVELGQRDLEVRVFSGNVERKLNFPQPAKINLKDML
ncbi:MAG: hypothetical protein ACRDHN_13820, partial [Thermomicrobiales bacterium]